MSTQSNQTSKKEINIYYKIAGFAIFFTFVFYSIILLTTVSSEVATSRKLKIQSEIQEDLKKSSLFVNVESVQIFAPLKVRLQNLPEKLKADKTAILFIDKKELIELLNRNEHFSSWQEYSYMKLTDVIEIHIFYPTKNISVLEYLPFINDRYFQWKYGVIIRAEKDDIKLVLKRFSTHGDKEMKIAPEISKSIKTDLDIWEKIKAVKVSPIGVIIEFTE